MKIETKIKLFQVGGAEVQLSRWDGEKLAKRLFDSIECGEKMGCHRTTVEMYEEYEDPQLVLYGWRYETEEDKRQRLARERVQVEHKERESVNFLRGLGYFVRKGSSTIGDT